MISLDFTHIVNASREGIDTHASMGSRGFVLMEIAVVKRCPVESVEMHQECQFHCVGIALKKRD